MAPILPAYLEGVGDEDKCVSVTMDEDLNLCQESLMSTFELLQLLFSSHWEGFGMCRSATQPMEKAFFVTKSTLQKRSYINALGS